MSSPPRATLAAVPRATPARRAKSSAGAGSNTDELARTEVLELTLFAEKKEWIEDKITFLATLPPVEVVSPAPPQLAAASRAELDAWWAEHERIETEVDEYDMGDLARMRQFARDKSKQGLSPRDTDLIEITLTTLFAVDRLLHLLRQRRKALTLLGYRLHWEEAVAAAWTAHRQVVTDLSTCLATAQWAPPASTRSRQPTEELVMPASPTLATSPSLPSLSSSHSLALLCTSTPSSFRAASTRTHLIAAQFSALSSLSRTLATSLVPASAAALDKLIDASPTPLPESFLDEQDRLEAECARADGLPAFLDAVRAQRQCAAELASEAERITARAADSAPEGLAALLREAIPALHAALERLPDPTHPLAPEQRTANAALRETLGAAVRGAKEAVARAEARVHARQRAQGVRARLEDVARRLAELEAQRAAAGGALQGLVDLPIPTVAEQARAATLQALGGPLRAVLADARALQPEAARVIVAAREAGLPREAGRAVRDAAEEVAARVRECEERLRREERDREEREIAREVLRAVEGARRLVDEAGERLAEEAGRMRWPVEEGTPAAEGSTSDGACMLDEVRTAQDALLAPALARADSLAEQGRAAPLAAPPAELARTVRDETAARLEPLARLATSARAQAAAVRDLDRELGAVEDALLRLTADVETLHDLPVTPVSPFEARLEAIAASLAVLASSAHERIPLLASAFLSRSAPFDAAAQDASVRAHVNERCARAAGLVVEARRLIKEVEHGREATAWDAEVERVEREVQQVELEVNAIKEANDARCTDLVARLDGITATSLPSVSSSLAGLRSVPPAADSRFAGAHIARQARLDDITARASHSREAVLSAQAEQRSQRTALLTTLASQAEVLTYLAKDAEGALAEASTASASLAEQKGALLCSSKLHEQSALDVTALKALKEQGRTHDERLTESLAALDALREQATGSSADEEVIAALAACTIASDAVRTVVNACGVARRALEVEAAAWPATRGEELQNRRRPAEAEQAREQAGRADAEVADAEYPDDVAQGAIAAVARDETVPPSPPSDTVEQPQPISQASGPVILLPSTPSPPPTLRRSLGSLGPLFDNGEADDPFLPASSRAGPFEHSTGFDEPHAVAELRQHMQEVTAHEWLDAGAVLQLPSVSDAQEIERLVAGCRAELAEIARLPHEKLLWTDLDALETAQQGKEAAAARVAALARFADKVVAADSALSDLLIAIDAATPGVPAPSPELSATSTLTLSDALVAASEAVTVVRMDAIPLIDDARVERAIGRIEESWSEMLSLVEDVQPRVGSAASSSSSTSLRLSTRTPRLSATQSTPSRPSSRATSLRSSTRESISSRSTSRASSTASIPSPRPSSGASSSRRESNGEFLILRTPRSRKSTEPDSAKTPTSHRRVKSGLPVATPRRAFSPVPKPTPTSAHPFSFDTPVKRELGQSISSIPRRSLATSTRRESSTSTASTASSLFSPKMQRTASMSSTRSAKRESTSSVRAFGSSSNAPMSSSRDPAHSPRVSSVSSPPSRRSQAQPYRPNMQNKLDREVGSIINGLPHHVQVPIRIAEGKWTDESGLYNIGGRVYFCRILRSKQVMVRVGGGWLNLLQFIISHFGQAEGLTILPSTSLSKNLGVAPQWISAEEVRDQLAASTSSASIRDDLASSVSSAARSDLGSSTSSISMRRSLSGSVSATPSLRRSIGGKMLASLPAAASPAGTTPRAPRTPRPPVPIWRP